MTKVRILMRRTDLSVRLRWRPLVRQHPPPPRPGNHQAPPPKEETVDLRDQQLHQVPLRLQAKV